MPINRPKLLSISLNGEIPVSPVECPILAFTRIKTKKVIDSFDRRERKGKGGSQGTTRYASAALTLSSKIHKIHTQLHQITLFG